MNGINEKKTEINLQSISNELLGYKAKPYDSLFEYIWNAFDASATRVEISYEVPEMGYINSIEIIDNGSGWDFSRDNTSYFLASDKALERANNKSLPRGRLGRGRYVFIWFFEKLEASSLGQKAIFTKDINYKFETSEIKKGIHLKFTGGTDVITQALKDTFEFQRQLVLEFGWFLKEIPNREIIINGKQLSITEHIEKSLTINKNDLPKELIVELGENAFQCEVVLWKEKPNEYAKFYFIDSTKTIELFVATTKLNKKKDEFWHSVYIYCDLFDKSDFQQESDNLVLELNSHNKLKKKILNELRRVLVELRKPILEKNADTVIKSLYEENIVPRLDKFGIYDTESFDALLKQVYVISPSIFVGKNKEEQSFICSMFAGILSSADESLIQIIIEQLQEMSEEDKSNLHDILKRTSLTNVTRTIKEIDRRLNVLAELEALLFTNKLETLEVKHLQEVLNRNI
jgi:hypothetical protein